MAAANSARSESPDSQGPISKRQQKREARLEQEYSRRLRASAGRKSRPPSAKSEVPTVTRSQPDPRLVPPEKRTLGWIWHFVIALLVICVSLLLKMGADSYMSETQGSKLVDMNPYEVLGVAKNATSKELKKAHRRLNLEWHPDRREDCDNACHAKFRQINEAYRILANADQRILYDKYQKVVTGSSKRFFTDMRSQEYLFSLDTWHNTVMPSLRGVMVPDRGERLQTTRLWALLVAEPTREWTEHMLPMWSDLADRFHGRINFMRVDSNSPEAIAALPVKLPLLPAVMFLSPHDSPHVYEKMMHMTPMDLAQWLSEHIPAVPAEPADPSALIRKFNKQGRDELGRPFILHISDKRPSKMLRALADYSTPNFHWVHMGNSSHVLAGISNLRLPEPSGKVKGVLVASTQRGPAAMHLSIALWNIDKIDLHKRISDPEATTAQAGKLISPLKRFLQDVTRSNMMPLFDENIGSLCTSRNEDESVVCAVKASPIPENDLTMEDADDANDITIQQVYITEKKSGLLESRLTRYTRNGALMLLDLERLRYKTHPDANWAAVRSSYRGLVRRMIWLPSQPMAPRMSRRWRERVVQMLIEHNITVALTSVLVMGVVALRHRRRGKEVV